ncbi:hypothetical protein [Pseudomonas bijieensis]|uniref:hypothetical protein n=1 Tax=Pseudomonas bijieensis TaxID=2681983 RepID=UPI001E621E16|nr:hypothetical protein [Pseudomonas bijieensis]MCD9118357.1 hypothetical protein [Pseudomonas bijieensis]
MYYTNEATATTRNSGAMRTAARTAVVVIGLVVGTGSNAACLVSERTHGYAKSKTTGQYITNIRSVSKSEGVDVRSPSQHLENIKSVLNLPVSETASIFGVTRQSIYKWLSTASAPEPDKAEKIKELSQIADRFKLANVDRPGDLISMKAFEGKSVLDLFRSGEDYSSLIPLLIEESKAMDMAYDKSNIANLPQGRTDDWKATISIPFSNDDQEV